MTFTESFRVERVYFEKLKNNITDIKNLLAAGNTEDARILLENSVDVDGAVLLLYRNLGECWAELADQIKKTRDELDALKEATEAYHDELNEKIDNVNFVLLRLINALEARLTVVENDLATMPRVKFLSLVYDETESAYSIQDANGETVSFEDVSAMAEFPHFIVLTDADGNYYMPEDSTESGFVWHIDNYNTTVDAYSDISVLLASDDSVTVSESTLPKLSAGYGIEINSDNEISVDTNDVQEKLIAGQNITLTPDVTDPTKTVIEAAGESYSAGFGIDISSNNEISVDTNDVQEKLIAGQNITLTPDVTDPTKTVIEASGGVVYTPGLGIGIDANNEISLLGVFPEANSSKSLFTHNDAVGKFTVPTNASYAEFLSGVNLFDNANLAYKWISAFMATKMFETQANTGSNNIEVKLNQWTDKTDFNIHTEIFFSTSAPTSQSITKGNGIAMKKEIRFENGALVMANFQTSAGKQIATYDNADMFVFPVRVTKNYYLFVRVYAYALDNTYDVSKLRTFLNSLDFTRLGALCRFNASLCN